MTVAAEAARVWNEREIEARAVPDPSPAVAARFAALWCEAVTVARAEFAEARSGWRNRVGQVEAEREALAADVEQVETERDEARQDAAAVREQAAVASATAAVELVGQRSRADKAEARAEAVEGERDRLVVERDGLLAERDKLRYTIRHAEGLSEVKE
jgi:small-conductance mechanosensitive channel